MNAAGESEAQRLHVPARVLRRVAEQLLDQHQAEDRERDAVEDREAHRIAERVQSQRDRELRDDARARPARPPPARATSCAARVAASARRRRALRASSSRKRVPGADPQHVDDRADLEQRGRLRQREREIDERPQRRQADRRRQREAAHAAAPAEAQIERKGGVARCPRAHSSRRPRSGDSGSWDGEGPFIRKGNIVARIARVLAIAPTDRTVARSQSAASRRQRCRNGARRDRRVATAHLRRSAPRRRSRTGRRCRGTACGS